MFSFFILSLLGLCAAAVATFIITFRTRSRLLIVFVPLIALCGSFAYFSYVSVLGYPVRMEWEDLPKQITVIYFRIVNKETITLWLFEGGKTRLVELPYIKPAEDGLEAARGEMGKGKPVTFAAKGKVKADSKGESGDDEEGDGNEDGKDGKKGKHGRRGWRYNIESYGQPIPGGALPPKVK